MSSRTIASLEQFGMSPEVSEALGRVGVVYIQDLGNPQEEDLELFGFDEAMRDNLRQVIRNFTKGTKS